MPRITPDIVDSRNVLGGPKDRVFKTNSMRTISRIDHREERQQTIQPYPSNRQVGRSAGYLDYPTDTCQIVDSVMREDTLSGKEYRDVLKLVGLSYDDQIWAYGLSLYRFLQTRDDSNLTRDEQVLRRLIAIGLYDNDAFQNSLPTRRAMMHSVAMAERLWEMSRAERDRVGLVVLGVALPVLTNRP